MTDCDCARCTTARYDTERRTTVDAVVWSGGLFRRYPGAAAAFGLVVVLEAVSRWVPFTGSEIVVFLLLVSARGYTDLCAVDDLVGADRGALGRADRVVRRLHVVVVARVLSLVLLVVPFVPLGVGVLLLPSSPETSPLGFVALIVAAGLGVAVAALTAAGVYVKFTLIPEACFVGGAGVVGSLRESWRSVSLGRVKTVMLVGAFSVVLGFLFSGIVGGSGGGDGAQEGALRVVSSAATTAFYAALFTHIYVERSFERDRSVHVPSASDAEDEEGTSGGSTSPSP